MNLVFPLGAKMGEKSREPGGSTHFVNFEHRPTLTLQRKAEHQQTCERKHVVHTHMSRSRKDSDLIAANAVSSLASKSYHTLISPRQAHPHIRPSKSKCTESLPSNQHLTPPAVLE